MISKLLFLQQSSFDYQSPWARLGSVSLRATQLQYIHTLKNLALCFCQKSWFHWIVSSCRCRKLRSRLVSSAGTWNLIGRMFDTGSGGPIKLCALDFGGSDWILNLSWNWWKYVLSHYNYMLLLQDKPVLWSLRKKERKKTSCRKRTSCIVNLINLHPFFPEDFWSYSDL